ncbi:MAG: amidohydrolase family protein [Candidatus Hydrogenedentota bacterium]
MKIRNGTVRSVRNAGRSAPDFGGDDAILAPTLFDIQVNGGFGIDLQSPDITVDGVIELTAKLHAWGVSRWCPTIITNDLDVMAKNCRTSTQAMDVPLGRRAIPGLHLEGPFISPEDGARGAHRRECVRPPSLKDFEYLYEAASGGVLYMTLAPERPGALEVIRAARGHGVAISLGHHAASREDISAAAKAGATLCTHLGNAISTTLHRHNNPLWPQLADSRLAISLLADGHHLPADVLKTFVRAKGIDSVVLTSDATHLAGLKPGRYDLAGVSVELKANGLISLVGTEMLAGSSAMLLECVERASNAAEIPLEAAVRCASAVPARLFRLRTASGSPREGRRADFVVFHARRGKIRPEVSFVRGVRYMI